jgi:hypothetical protein
MATWKMVLLRSAGFGAGFAIALCVIGGSWFWYEDRPKPPKPWNKQAIIAEYDYVRPEGDNDNLVFHYLLQNNTDADYRIDSDVGINLANRLKKQKSFGSFSNQYVTTDYPIFVPARSRVWIPLKVPYPYSIKEKDNPNKDERQEYTIQVAKYVTSELPNLDGFVLFDTLHRYEIDFPGGWEKRAAQASANKQASKTPAK